jgi:OmpA-OmpF porin, OOP family
MRVWAVAVLLGVMAGGSTAQEAPGQSGPFRVFFDWSKPDIRSDDAATLDKVAEAYRARPSIQLQLIGHTDRSGSAWANRAAGLRRAQAVRAELEKRGVPRNAIGVTSFGEDRPLVPTEDGVREVQNRRVEISIEE